LPRRNCSSSSSSTFKRGREKELTRCKGKEEEGDKKKRKGKEKKERERKKEKDKREKERTSLGREAALPPPEGGQLAAAERSDQRAKPGRRSRSRRAREPLGRAATKHRRKFQKSFIFSIYISESAKRADFHATVL
jgi:hypothetical protein